MHPVIKFYQTLAQYLESCDPAYVADLDLRLDGIYKRCRRGEFRLLNQNEWRTARNRFQSERKVLPSMLLLAFRDLSRIKNPHAMAAFRALQKVGGMEGELYLFTSNVKIREGGQSSVMTIHVSNHPAFIDRLKEFGILHFTNFDSSSKQGFSLWSR